MKPEQFIREFGVEKAREVVEGAPDKTATHWVFRKIPNYYSVDFQSWFHDGEWWDSDCHTEQDLIDSYGEDFVVSLSDLKRLVESLERINKCGGLYGFKTYCNGDYSQEDLQAIRDHESIYGGGDES
ncbi:hypothetical protein NE421_04640 [Acinetobacter baumannii]|uniref:hypothetical protein n=1 Tax=Acinetobacter baumannii TaxID=470 RepID=UPI00207900E5|nr:hypothetical protein [Acinetobacter baumannii]USI39628.1 hypothetical protein NE421_04640 [Acinetobacter baumannii]USI44310.1 hypothetical protein NE424_08920 [Acinetobacter baumannii]